MKRSIINISLLILIVMLFIPARNTSAIPAFARKYQISCQVCHSPAIPGLKAFGDDFADARLRGGGQGKQFKAFSHYESGIAYGQYGAGSCAALYAVWKYLGSGSGGTFVRRPSDDGRTDSMGGGAKNVTGSFFCSVVADTLCSLFARRRLEILCGLFRNVFIGINVETDERAHKKPAVFQEQRDLLVHGLLQQT